MSARRAGALATALVLVSACSVSAPAPEPRPSRVPRPVSVSRPTPPAPAPTVVTADPRWQSWRAASAALQSAIDTESARVAAGEGRPAALASYRMTADARLSVLRGDNARALAMLERAVEMDGRNGFAYLYLAWLHYREGRPAAAAGFADHAERHLPELAPLRGELLGLRAALDGGPSGARSR